MKFIKIVEQLNKLSCAIEDTFQKLHIFQLNLIVYHLLLIIHNTSLITNICKSLPILPGFVVSNNLRVTTFCSRIIIFCKKIFSSIIMCSIVLSSPCSCFPLVSCQEARNILSRPTRIFSQSRNAFTLIFTGSVFPTYAEIILVAS